MRDENGTDVPFQFIIEKAKVQSEVTITLEAEGDPSTFEMTLSVLRDSKNNEMMRLVRYTIDKSSGGTAENDIGSMSSSST